MALLAAALLWLAALLSGAHAAGPDTLWHIVHERCVPNMIAHDDPAPCTAVDLAHGTLLLKDLVGVAQFLLMPTAKVTGIEDPAALAPDGPDYFAAAWAARGEVAARLGRHVPREAIGLALNSALGRSQNQLHIHIDCLRADVRATLAASSISDQWAPLAGGLAGHPYLAMRLAGEALAARPLRLLADGIPGASGEMGRYTLVVAGAAGGFILLADRANPLAGNFAHGEELQDHTCHGT